ncbi:MAG: hypothetical protein WA397_09840, partial [Roseiarcus sp.]
EGVLETILAQARPSSGAARHLPPEGEGIRQPAAQEPLPPRGKVAPKATDEGQPMDKHRETHHA